ncbi:MAG: hypothetical protein QOJ29_1066 [Thermoleophilaceae bacterium]|nr:hypothetical protein [Thermoleophilaceae bacterium]
MTCELTITTLNVASPSTKRAERILDWLGQRDDDILILTETRATEGTHTLSDGLAGAGWEVRLPQLGDRERGVLLASRLALAPRAGDLVTYLPGRVEAATIAGAEIDVIGVYIPSRDHTEPMIARKRRFVDELRTALARAQSRPTVLLGDLNILEPDHWPRHTWFHPWEYELYESLLSNGWTDAYRAHRVGTIEHSWVSPDGDGYRFDHAFVSSALQPKLVACHIVHEPRETGLSDHSALELRVASQTPKRLETAATLQAGPPALF